MNSSQVPPPEYLGPFVERFFIQAVDILGPTTPIPAMTSSLVMINVGDLYDMRLANGNCVPGYRLMAFGPITTPSVFINESVQVRLVAARLRPGVLPRILPDASALVDQSRSLEGLAGVDASICSAIVKAPDDAARLELLATFLEGLLAEHPAELDGRAQLFTRALDIIDKGPRDLQVNDIADSLGVSSVTLRTAFKVCAGLTPKSFLRIRRMEQVLRDFHETPDPEYMARVFGFYDQAHFIHEFQKFCGISPLEFLNAIQLSDQHQVHNNLA